MDDEQNTPKRRKGVSVRTEIKRLRSEGKLYVNKKNIVVEGKPEPKEEVCAILQCNTLKFQHFPN